MTLVGDLVANGNVGFSETPVFGHESLSRVLHLRDVLVQFFGVVPRDHDGALVSPFITWIVNINFKV